MKVQSMHKISSIVILSDSSNSRDISRERWLVVGGEAQEQWPACRVVVLGIRFARSVSIKGEEVVHGLNNNMSIRTAITK